MRNLITNAAFIGRYQIANATTSPEVIAQLNYLITTYQPVFLRMLLSPAKYTEFQAWFDIAPDDRPINAAWSALLTGTDFTDSWGVIRHAEPVTTPFTSFCYDKFQRGNVTQTAGMGEVATDIQNGTPGSPQQKLIDRWNEMAEYDKNIFWYLNKAFATDSVWRDWFRYQCGFTYWAYDGWNDLPTPKAEIFQFINQFGL